MKLAWLALPLVLLVALFATGSAFALAESDDAPAESASQGSVEIELEEECGEGEEEVEGAEEEAEEECEGEGSGSSPTEDCYLRTAKARAIAYPAKDMMRLTLGYTTFAPTKATVEYAAKHGGRLGVVSRHLGHSGVVRLSKHLSDREMSQLQGSNQLTVTVHVPEAPRTCQRFGVQQLQIAQNSDSRITWSEN